MEECRKAQDYLSKNNPFSSIPSEYKKNSIIIKNNEQWVLHNLEEIKIFLNNAQLEEVRRAFGFPYNLDWFKEEE